MSFSVGECVIIGDGTEVPTLKELSRSLGLADCVDFAGRVSDHDSL